MKNSVAVNQPVKTPQMLFGSDNINDFGNRVKAAGWKVIQCSRPSNHVRLWLSLIAVDVRLPLAFMFTQWMLLVAHVFSLRELSH
ncbi:hypothetical protein ACUQZ3_001073 [Enterobacter hormaechei]